MIRASIAIAAFLPVLAACGTDEPPSTNESANRSAPDNPPIPVDENAGDPTDDAAANEPAQPSAPAPQPRLLALDLTRAEWRKAENKATCAPLVLSDDGGAGSATARRANMSGGWGVAFDQPGLRSAFGVAGAGVAVKDFAAEAKRIKDLWPYVRPIGARAGGLPAGSLAGYGLDGAAPFDAGNPTGKGQRMGAYVVIPGQGCLYNLWSHLGRAQMEAMLDGLALAPIP